MKKKLALSWNLLPHEILHIVAKYVNKADLFKLGQVCKVWRNAFRSLILWQHVDIKNPIWHRKPESDDKQIGAIRIMLELARSVQSKFA